jgi:hypothetical protein
MTKSFFDFVKAGVGRIEFVFHVGGFPYGVSTHDDVATVLNANLSAKRTVFGNAQNNNDSSYYADSVPLFANLDPDSIRESSVRMDESKGVLRGGSWEVTIFDKDIGYDWPYRNGSGYWGLDGIHTTINPLLDRDIYWGYLYANFKTGSSSISVSDEVGGDLDTKVQALTGDDTMLAWVDHECIAIDGRNGLLDPSGYIFTVDGRGLYRSREAEHFLDPDRISRKMVCDAPLGGIGGRAGYVWAIVLDPNDNTALLCDPALILKGRVRPTVKTSEGKTRIQCSSVLSWLDSKVESPEIPNIPGNRRHLDKYVLYRGANSGTISKSLWENHQCPHLVIREYQYENDDGSEFRAKTLPVWLCSKGSSVTYDTLDDLYLALNEELSRLHERKGTALNNAQTTGADSTGENQRVHTDIKYSVSSDGVFIQENFAYQWYDERYTIDLEGDLTTLEPLPIKRDGWTERTIDYGVSEINGPLAWLLQLGPIAGKREFNTGGIKPPDVSNNQRSEILRKLKNGDHWFNYYSEVRKFDSHWMSAVTNNDTVTHEDMGGLFTEAVQISLQSNGPDVSDNGYGRDYASKYIYQTSDWTDAINTWPKSLPKLEADGLPKNKTAKSFIPVNNYLWLSKDTDISIDEVEQDVKYSIGYKADYMIGASSSGPGESGGLVESSKPRYGDVQVTAISNTTQYPRLTLDSGIEYDANNKSPFTIGMTLFFLPFLEPENRDPWSFKSKFNFSTNSLGNAFRTMMGEELTTPKIGKRFTLSHVPDFINDSSGDFEWSIDFYDLEKYTFPFTNGHYFNLVVDQDLQILKLFAEELKLFGIHMTREWDGLTNTFVYRFHRIGEMNGTKAFTENRFLNDTNLVRGSIKEEHNDTWLFNQANIKTNWNGEKFESPELIVKDASGFGSIGSVDRIFKVESKLTQFKDLKDIAKSQWPELKRHIANNILVNMLRPMPTYSFRAGLNAALMLSVGKEVLVTDSSASQPYTHEPGLTSNVCLITEMSINWGRGRVRGKYRVGDKIEYGIAPSMLVQSGNSSISSPPNPYVSITPDDHEYTDTDFRKDLSFFDCIGWNKSTRSYANLDCGCSDYRVLCIEKDSNDPDVILATIYDVDMTAGTAKLKNDTDTIDALWDTAKDWVIVYAPSDDANTQSCQLQWTYMADPRDGLIDTYSSTLRARRWK